MFIVRLISNKNVLKRVTLVMLKNGPKLHALWRVLTEYKG